MPRNVNSVSWNGASLLGLCELRAWYHMTAPFVVVVGDGPFVVSVKPPWMYRAVVGARSCGAPGGGGTGVNVNAVGVVTPPGTVPERVSASGSPELTVAV